MSPAFARLVVAGLIASGNPLFGVPAGAAESAYPAPASTTAASCPVSSGSAGPVPAGAGFGAGGAPARLSSRRAVFEPPLVHPSPRRHLAFTGLETLGLLGLAAAAFVGGWGLLVASNKKRRYRRARIAR